MQATCPLCHFYIRLLGNPSPRDQPCGIDRQPPDCLTASPPALWPALPSTCAPASRYGPPPRRYDYEDDYGPPRRGGYYGDRERGDRGDRDGPPPQMHPDEREYYHPRGGPPPPQPGYDRDGPYRCVRAVSARSAQADMAVLCCACAAMLDELRARQGCAVMHDWRVWSATQLLACLPNACGQSCLLLGSVGEDLGSQRQACCLTRCL